jgi:hypothetical protein
VVPHRNLHPASDAFFKVAIQRSDRAGLAFADPMTGDRWQHHLDWLKR